MWIRVCRYKNAGVAGYAEAFIPGQSDSQASEWYSYFENDVLEERTITRRHIMTDITKNEIGTFIAACRKEKKLTQKQLGEKLNVTDRAVSKWETGVSLR